MAVLESRHLTEAAMKQDGLSGVSTGLTDLDKLLGGLHRSDLLILAARPSMGKTALATNIAFNVAASTRAEKDAEGNPIEQRQPVAFFSLEMSAEQLAGRVIAERTGVRSDAMRRGDIQDEEFDKIFEASRELAELPLFVDDHPAPPVNSEERRGGESGLR